MAINGGEIINSWSTWPTSMVDGTSAREPVQFLFQNPQRRKQKKRKTRAGKPEKATTGRWQPQTGIVSCTRKRESALGCMRHAVPCKSVQQNEHVTNCILLGLQVIM